MANEQLDNPEFFIKGIVGGGYKPMNNFKLSDLSPEMYADLVAVRPEFGTAGRSAGIMQIIETLELDADAWQEDEQRFVVQKWATGADFLRRAAGYDGRDVVDLYLGDSHPSPPTNREILDILEDNSGEEIYRWELKKKVRSPEYLRNFALQLAYENPKAIPVDFDTRDKDSIDELLDNATGGGKLITEYFEWMCRDQRTEHYKPAPVITEAVQRGIELYEITQPQQYDAQSEIENSLEYLVENETEYGTKIEYSTDKDPVYQTLDLAEAKAYADKVDNHGKSVPDWDRDISLGLGGDWHTKDNYRESLQEFLDENFSEQPDAPAGFSFPDSSAPTEIPWEVPPEQESFEFPGKGVKITSLRSPLFKGANVPEDLEMPEAPVPRQHDLVNRVLQWYIDNRTEELPWKDFQKRFPFAQNSPLFTQIRRNGPVVTRAQLQDWLDNEGPADKDYGISFQEYHNPEQSFRDVKQLVLQINHGAYSRSVMKEDPMLGKYVEYVGMSSGYSGHPANDSTVGWVRLDFVDKDWLLVDEVQSDLINSVSQAKAIVQAENFQEFLAGLANEHVRQQAIAKMNEGADHILEQQQARQRAPQRQERQQATREQIIEQRYQQGRSQFIHQGYTVEALESIRRRLTELFKDWTEYAMSSLLEIARKHGIKYVAVHTSEGIAGRDPSVEADKVGMYYDTLAKSFGFQKQTVDLGGQTRDFWVRQASKKP